MRGERSRGSKHSACDMGEVLKHTCTGCALRFAHSPLRPRSPSETLALTVSLTPCRYPRPYPNSPADKTQPEESSQKKVISPTAARSYVLRPSNPATATHCCENRAKSFG